MVLRKFFIFFFFHLADPNSFPGSHAATSLSIKRNSVSTSPARRSDNDQLHEEIKETDDFEKELLELNEEKTEREGDMSPPPTLDESMSDHDSSPVTIAAIVTSKTLESPRSVIFTSLSRPTSGSSEIPKNSEDFEEAADSFDVNRRVTSASNILDSEPDLPSVPIDEVSLIELFCRYYRLHFSSTLYFRETTCEGIC